MENAFNIDSIFGKIPKIPSMLDRFTHFKENEAVELTVSWITTKLLLSPFGYGI